MSQRKKAIALSFEPQTMNAPQISARGERSTAEQLVRTARRYGVPVVKDPRLVKQLGPLLIDQEIPSSLYEDVAELFVRLSRN